MEDTCEVGLENRLTIGSGKTTSWLTTSAAESAYGTHWITPVPNTMWTITPSTATFSSALRPHACPICKGRCDLPGDFYDEAADVGADIDERATCRSCGGRGIVWG